MMNNQHHWQGQGGRGSAVTDFEERVWMHHQHNEDGAMQYAAAYHFTGKTNIGRLVAALNKLPQFVPSLNICYQFDEDAGLLKYPGHALAQPINIEAVDSVADAIAHLQTKQATSFALESQSPIQFTVYICGEQEIVLGVISHQILEGGLSWQEIFEVLSALYNHGLAALDKPSQSSQVIGFSPLQKLPDLSASHLPWLQSVSQDIDIVQAGVSEDVAAFLQAAIPRKFTTVVKRDSYEKRLGKVMSEAEILAATAVLFARYITESNGLDSLNVLVPCDISRANFAINGAMIESGLSQLTLTNNDSHLEQAINDVLSQLGSAKLLEAEPPETAAALVTWLVDPAQYLSLTEIEAKKLPVAPRLTKCELTLAVGLNCDGDLAFEWVTGASVSPHLAAYLFEQFIAYIGGERVVKPAPQGQSKAESILPQQKNVQDHFIVDTILAEFRSALTFDEMSKDDDFFDFGGHSLIGTRVIGRLLKDHGIAVAIADLFTYRTAAELAKHASKIQPDAPSLANKQDNPPAAVPSLGAVVELILAEFKEALATDDMTATDDFFDFGGHSLIATRVIGRLLTHHGIAININDLFGNPTAQSLAEQAVLQVTETAQATTALTEVGSNIAPLSLAQNSLWKAIPKYAKFGLNTIFNLPFVLRFLDELDEVAFGEACRDLLIRHASLRSHFYEDNGLPCQRVVDATEIDSYKWYWTSAECDISDRDEFLKQEAIHPFDLKQELPLRVRFIRCQETGLQFLSFLFHHIVQDEWSVNLMMDELNFAYKQRVQGKSPSWRYEALPMHEYARMQRSSGAHQTHLDYWLNNLKGVPWSTPIFPKHHPLSAPTDPNGAKGGWVIVEIEDEVRDGLYALAKAQSASLFNVVYASIAAALNAVGAPNKLIVGTSASGRHDVEYYDTIGYFTTVVAHLVDFDRAHTVAELVAQVKHTINESMPYGDIPIDLIEEGLVGGEPDVDGHMFEVFIQLHAKSKFSGAFELPNGDKVNFQQVDSDRSESGLGLQFEVLEETVNEEQVLRVMMSYLTENYSQAQVKLLCDTLNVLFTEFAKSAKGEQLLGTIKQRVMESPPLAEVQ
ncbi:condensation domain-containing protein [Motilimonas sp. 1_MG-2023]|uniref:condensation domain-containing protein n=1 Tax=Motilimonas sp. 1_MG-2023 TaxID=3062672 RepID=UPI0026E13AEB|nr:condensation domain-containing protein [Motilimonas sp. 1_MG-2023]MDO6525098.1 condensation domain-containing protein [Motilimonas sp. 1_MG-2023]